MNPHRSKLILAFAALLSAILAAATIAMQSNQKQADGVVKVDLGGVVERGNTKIEEADPAKLPSLPQGFAPLNGKAYQITNDGIVYGPFDVVFKVSSVTDEQTFKNLRVLHVEPDEFDPDSYVWVDRTGISNSKEPGHDFREKTIMGNTRELDAGIYMVVKVVPKNEANADLEVTAKGVPESAQMPATLRLVVTIKNRGPQLATDVGVLTELPRGEVVSAQPSQGACKDRGLFCIANWAISPPVAPRQLR